MSIETYPRMRFSNGTAGGPNLYHFDPGEYLCIEKGSDRWFLPGDLVRHTDEDVTGFGLVIGSERPTDDVVGFDGYVVVLWMDEPENPDCGSLASSERMLARHGL